MNIQEKFQNGLFIFRRDLRIIDNNGLNLLSKICKNIYTIFIFTPEQVGNNNKYKSENSVQFMIESIEDLSSEIIKNDGKLYTFYGDNNKIVEYCIQNLNIEVVCFNLDYTPYAKERDASIIGLCEKLKTYVIYDYDYYLNEPDTIKTGNGTPYQKFTPYYNSAVKKIVKEPLRARKINFMKSSKKLMNLITLDEAVNKFTKDNPNILVHGGRKNAMSKLKTFKENIKIYTKTHNDLSQSTSELSAYIKFGCLSIREVYNLFRSNHTFIRQLYWRDFYGQLLYHYPNVLGHPMKQNYNKIKWHHNSSWFTKWCNGITGFPIVDACMRQLNTTGYMHNRGRLIVASFLIKTLLIDWRYGEKYFSNRLVDYDVSNNNLNWQWCASTAVDSQPYFRIFNPWRQQEEYDPNCTYIKKWIPELSNLENKIIHKWNEEFKNYKDIKYPIPICNYEKQKEKALAMYKAIY